jgi:outer membrane protein assembly factor BamD
MASATLRTFRALGPVALRPLGPLGSVGPVGDVAFRTAFRKRLPAALLAVAFASACASAPPPQSFEDLPSAEELYLRGQEEMAEAGGGVWFFGGDYSKAIATFQDIIDNYPYSEQSVLAHLAIGDSYFQQGKFDEAISYYRDFVELHPSHERVPYAMFQTVMSYYKQSRDASRDQTATQEALTHLDRLLARYPSSEVAREGEKLWKELRTRLGQHTLHVADFYFGNSEYASAADRYRQLLDQYPGLGLDAEALYKLGVCYQRMNRADEAQQIFQVILDNDQGTEVAEAARDLVPAAN